MLVEAPSAPDMRRWHEMLAEEPHIAGTPGDERVIEKLIATFESFGLEVERQDIWPLLCEPVAAAVEIVAPDTLALSIKEPPVEGDELSNHPALTIGWNAYSASGDVTAPVVYANFGRREDFIRLRELGVDCAGKIVVARYGGNFRGYKARYAQESGAVGLIIYTDPNKPLEPDQHVFPEGGFPTPEQIQRGSINTLPHSGDPLTPFEPATEHAKRLSVDAVGLPGIPVQPVGAAAGAAILSRMHGVEAPAEWAGGLAAPYRLTDDTLRVRLMVEQRRLVKKTANVIARLPGALYPDEVVVIGSHHDAWGFGAGDPLAGTIVTVEAARVFAEAAKAGLRPARTLAFACWGAEEFGVLGSTEWVEANRASLLPGCVAYINLDAAAMGPDFEAAASPALRPLILEAAERVPSARTTDDLIPSVATAWLDRERAAAAAADPPRPLPSEPEIRDLGGGSDHDGFVSHVGAPAMSLGAGGAPGSAYHSNYDHLVWYRRVVGEDYESALMVARMTCLLAGALADADVIPLDIAREARSARASLDALREKARSAGLSADFGPATHAALRLERKAQGVLSRLRERAGAGEIAPEALARANRIVLSAPRAWLSAEGLPDRPWRRNLSSAPDETSGYSAWPLPGVQAAILREDDAMLAEALTRVGASLSTMSQMIDAINAVAP
jgi:N-acetylated-alpha-linked acidic dipeptidase